MIIKHTETVPYNTKQIDVGIVHSKIHKHNSSPSRYPSFIKQSIYNRFRSIHRVVECLNISCSTVGCQHTPVGGAIKVILTLVGSTENQYISRIIIKKISHNILCSVSLITFLMMNNEMKIKTWILW